MILLHKDPGDAMRRAYISAVIDRMSTSPEIEDVIRTKAKGLLARKKQAALTGKMLADRWDVLLDMEVSQLSVVLLQDGPEGVEMRHAHMFAGALNAKETNLIMRSVRCA